MFTEIWKRDSLSPEDLPTVRTIFEELLEDDSLPHFCDELAQRYIDADVDEGLHHTPTQKDAENLLRHVVSQFDAISSPDETKYVLIPHMTIEPDFEHDNRFELNMTSSLYEFEQLPNYHLYDDEKPIALPSEETYEYDSERDAKAPVNGYAYEMTDWSIILAYRVWCPELSEKQLMQFYADIFWEMTFFGITYEETQEEQENLEEELAQSMNEIEEVKAKGELESVLHSVDIDAMLTEAYGPYRREYQKFIREFETVFYHNMAIYNVATVNMLADKLKK